MKFELNVPAALAKGAVNIFKLAHSGEYVLAICFYPDSYIIPIIGKRAYIPDDLEEDIADRIDAMISQIIESKAFTDPALASVKPIFRTAPEHSMTIVQCLPAKGLAKGMDTEAILVSAGYKIEYPTAPVAVAKKKDYSELMATNPDARHIYEATKAELAKVGATFSSLTKEMVAAYDTVMGSNEGGILLAGPTGTGKSWACKIMSALSIDSPAPLLEYQVTSGTTVEDLVGTFIPNDSTGESEAAKAEIHHILVKLSAWTDKDGSSYKEAQDTAFSEIREIISKHGGDSKWRFVAGPLLMSYADGWQFVLNEVNYGNAATLSCINQFTDGTQRIFINGRLYERNPNFISYMTMNPGYEGTDPLNMALKNRFSVVNVPPLPKDEFTRRLVGYTKGLGHELSAAFFSKLFDFSMVIEKLGDDTQYHENVKFSVRNAQRLCLYMLQKPRSKEEFFAAMAIQYVNHLTTDNDNSEKVERLKHDESIVAQMSSIYDEYSFSAISLATSKPALSDIFTIKDDAPTGGDGSKIDDADLDAMFDAI